MHYQYLLLQPYTCGLSIVLVFSEGDGDCISILGRRWRLYLYSRKAMEIDDDVFFELNLRGKGHCAISIKHSTRDHFSI